MNEDVFTIDPASVDRLGRSNADQRAERKEAESKAQKALNAVMVTVVLTVAAIALMAAGVFIGATKPEVWNYVPGVPSPSGERAEPEESAR